jgi:hypothetical protein
MVEGAKRLGKAIKQVMSRAPLQPMAASESPLEVV